MATLKRLEDTLFNLNIHEHLCLVYETQEEKHAAVIPFIKTGIERNEKCIFIGAVSSVEALFSAMAEYNTEAASAVESGTLKIATPENAFIKGGRFDPHAMIEFLSSELEKSKEEGYTALRAAVDMTCVPDADRNSESLIEYEYMLGDFASANDFLVLCQYDIKVFPAETMTNIIKTHPKIIYHKAITGNYFYEPSGLNSGNNIAGKKLEKMLSAIMECNETLNTGNEEEFKLKAAFELNPGALSISTFEDGVFIEVNDNFSRITGYQTNEIMGKSAFKIGFWAKPEDGLRLRELLKKDNTVRNFEFESRKKNGESLWVLLSATLINYRGRLCILAQSFDITEKIIAVRTARAKTEELDRFFTSALDLLCIADTDGNFIRLNPMWSEVLGYPLTELEGKRFLDLVHPDDIPSTMEAINELDNGKNVLSFSNRYLSKDGSWRWLDWRSFPYGNKLIYAAARDVTERIKAEKALKQSEEKYRIISENTGDVIWMLDPVSAKFTYVSPSVERLRGWTAEEVMAQPLENALTPESFTSLANELPGAISAVEAGDENAKVRFDYVDQTHKNGSVVHTEVVTTFLTGDNGKVNLIIGVSRDITERRADEEKLREVQKLESLGVLAGGIAHDFNNLLMVILGNIDMSLISLPANSPVVKNLKAAEKACQSAADLTKQMLAYAGKGQFFLQEISFENIISEIDMVMSISISRKISLIYNIDKVVPSIIADPGQMKQMIMNLVMNASEAIGDKQGNITVSIGRYDHTANTEEKGKIFLKENLIPGEYTFIEVTDTGEGIDEESILKIFDPFFTTRFIGRGLGLAAVMGILRSLKGTVRVESQMGKGSIFTLYLPTSSGRSAFVKSGSGVLRKTVLIVDDEEDVVKLGSQMLETLGYETITAKNGAEALDIIRKHESDNITRISLILLDIGMPVMNGEELYEELMKMGCDIPIFISSGYGETDIEERFKDRKVAGMLHKPYKFEALKKILVDT